MLIAKTPSFEDAVRAANAGWPAVTVVESRKPSNIEHARRMCRAANVLINFAPSHERIARQPWGAPAPGGHGALFGGAGLLKRFIQPQLVTENMMRQGFAPEVEEAEEASA
jgi:RHH-type proline utilization regulon transcriptional repressor/proline dehydrogenase/delta 1-pyrroline-5-carboxylate dehydrogenase